MPFIFVTLILTNGHCMVADRHNPEPHLILLLSKQPAAESGKQLQPQSIQCATCCTSSTIQT